MRRWCVVCKRSRIRTLIVALLLHRVGLQKIIHIIMYNKRTGEHARVYVHGTLKKSRRRCLKIKHESWFWVSVANDDNIIMRERLS
jgi:hypothetical protein